MPEIKVLALVGSLRTASINRQIAELATEVAPDGVTVTVFEGLGDLPFYNEEIDDVMNTDAPPLCPVAALRAAATDADAALVVTPEYNGSYPAVIKNAIDWLSRPFGDSALKGKPLAVIGGSFGQYGGVWAHDDTRKSFGIAHVLVRDRFAVEAEHRRDLAVAYAGKAALFVIENLCAQPARLVGNGKERRTVGADREAGPAAEMFVL